MELKFKSRAFGIIIVLFALVATVVVTMIAGPKEGKDISKAFRKFLTK